MNETSIIYCDESGNDGPNYLNEDEPFYVLAGWGVPERALVDAGVEMESLRQQHCRDAPELKFKSLKKRPWVVCQLMSRLGQLGFTPIYVVAEKRYCVAGKIVETFLDPHYNSRLSARFTSDVPTKQELANTLYERLDLNALRTFAEAYRAPAQGDLERALVRIAGECRRCVNPELAELIEGSLPKVAEIAEAEVTAVTSWGKTLGTLNFPCLISFLMLVEELGQQQLFRPKKIVHDEQGPYQEDYRRAFQMCRGAQDARILLNGTRVPYGAIRMIDDFEVQRSIDQPLVQAADLLAGSIAHLARALIRGRQLRKQELELGGLLLPALLVHDLTIAMPICSNCMLRKFGDAIRRVYPDVHSDTKRHDGEEELSFRWTSTLPDSGSLPVLPAKPLSSEPVAEPDVSVKITLPLFGLANDSADQLVLLLPFGQSYEECCESERCLPLWTRRESAESFLQRQDWAKPHHVVEFGPKEIPELVARLRSQAKWTNFVGLNLFDDAAPLPITQLADDLERIWDRLVRSMSSGLGATLVHWETIHDHKIVSVLLSSGTYAAMKMPDGPFASAATREKAVANVAVQLA